MNTLEPAKSVCIVGGGFAGLAAAVFLDALGLKITLIERKPILGGRAFAFQDKKTGHWVDNGQHLLIGAYHETIKLIETIGASHHLRTQDSLEVPLFNEQKKLSTFSLPSLPPPFNFLKGLWRFKNISLKQRLSFLSVMRGVQRYKANPAESEWELPVSLWLKNNRQSDQAIKNFWEILILATLNEDPQLCATRYLMEVLNRTIFSNARDSRLVLPKYNLNEILAHPAARYLQYRGHSILTQSAAREFHILDERVVQLNLTNGEKLKADYFFSAVPPRALHQLIPSGYRDTREYFQNLAQLKTSPIISFNLWFEEDFLPHDFVGSSATRVHWFFNKNRLYKRPYPPYHYMGVISGAHALINESKEELLKLVLDDLALLYPQSKKIPLVHSLINKEVDATLSPAPGVEALRPTQKTPFANFYVIGDWTKTGLPATIESSVVSARLAVDDMLANWSTAGKLRQQA